MNRKKITANVEPNKLQDYNKKVIINYRYINTLNFCYYIQVLTKFKNYRNNKKELVSDTIQPALMFPAIQLNNY